MSEFARARPAPPVEGDGVASRRDRLRLILWIAAAAISAAAVVSVTGQLEAAARGTVPSFVALAAVIGAGAGASRLGVFRGANRIVGSERLPARLAPVAVLTFTALVSGLVNLDVAAVVAPSTAIWVARRRRFQPGPMVVATALTCNATSFLLPTANVTNLLVIARSSIGLGLYLRDTWAAWALVTALTVASLSLAARRSPARRISDQREPDPRVPLLPVLLDLLPMLVIATAVRALLSGGLPLLSGPAIAFFEASLMAAVGNNLPVAAAIAPAGGTAMWVAVWAMAMGPNLLVTGSVASLICRRTALEQGFPFDLWRFSLLGAVLLPLQFAAAYAGLIATTR